MEYNGTEASIDLARVNLLALFKSLPFQDVNLKLSLLIIKARSLLRPLIEQREAQIFPKISSKANRRN